MRKPYSSRSLIKSFDWFCECRGHFSRYSSREFGLMLSIISLYTFLHFKYSWSIVYQKWPISFEVSRGSSNCISSVHWIHWRPQLRWKRHGYGKIDLLWIGMFVVLHDFVFKNATTGETCIIGHQWPIWQGNTMALILGIWINNESVFWIVCFILLLIDVIILWIIDLVFEVYVQQWTGPT